MTAPATPLWSVSVEDGGGNPDIFIEAEGYGTVAEITGGAPDVRRAHAALIVKAVNHHERLLAALRGLVARAELTAEAAHGVWVIRSARDGIVHEARQALAAAEGE